LETATKHEDEFKTSFQAEVAPTRVGILRMTYGDGQLWNGILLRDDLFPHRESFDIADYRDLLERIRSTKMAIGDIMTDVVPPLRDDYIDDGMKRRPESSQPDSIAFY